MIPMITSELFAGSVLTEEGFIQLGISGKTYSETLTPAQTNVMLVNTYWKTGCWTADIHNCPYI